MNDDQIRIVLDERPLVAESMIKYGGGFAGNLGKALQHADFNNALRIAEAFPELWKQYLAFAEQK